MDIIGWYLATSHQMLGHDKAAALLGVDPGDKTRCILCRFEAGQASREDVQRQIGQAEPEPAGYRCWSSGDGHGGTGVTHHVHGPGEPCPLNGGPS